MVGDYLDGYGAQGQPVQHGAALLVVQQRVGVHLCAAGSGAFGNFLNVLDHVVPQPVFEYLFESVHKVEHDGTDHDGVGGPEIGIALTLHGYEGEPPGLLEEPEIGYPHTHINNTEHGHDHGHPPQKRQIRKGFKPQIRDNVVVVELRYYPPHELEDLNAGGEVDVGGVAGGLQQFELVGDEGGVGEVQLVGI